MSIKTILHLLIIFSLGLIAQKTVGQNIRVEANFTPSSISSTSRTVYKVVLHGTQQNPQGSLPQVQGLRISNNPQSLRSANFINGVPSVRVELNFQVQPQRTGNFTVPVWKVMIEGKSYQVPPATLQVLDPSQQEKQAQLDLRQAAFLELPFPRSYFFEGETIMTSLTLFIWDRLPVNRIENAPTKIGESFSSNNLGKWTEEKRNVSRNGKIYSTFNWPVALTAAMAGTKEISFTVNLRVRVNSRKNSPFSSPFFNDPFFGFGREESLTVELPTKSIEIKPLPSTNRPSDYSGAIGSFRAQYSVDANQVEVGDPVRLNFSIEGKGNFAAIPAPILESNEEFKIGPPAFLFFLRTTNRSIIFACLAWAGGLTLLAFVVFDSTRHKNLTESQVIALLDKKQGDDNASETIPLRRFAASSSTANASVRAGESLFVDQSQLEGYQSHQGPNSQNWLLVRTADNLKKGWVRQDEVGWILKN